MRLTTQEEIKKHLDFSLMIKSPERVTVTGALPELFFRIMADANKPSGFDNHLLFLNSLITPRICRSHYQVSQRLRSKAARLSVAHERGFRPACEVNLHKKKDRIWIIRSLLASLFNCHHFSHEQYFVIHFVKNQKCKWPC